MIDTKNINFQNTYYSPRIVNNETTFDCYSRYPYEIQNERYNKYHEYVLPRFNTLNLPSYFNISNRLMYSIHKDKPNSQPDVWCYNPYQSYFIKYDNVSSNEYSIKDKHKMSYYDIMKDSLNQISNRYETIENIYHYDEYQSDSFNELRISLNGKTRDELLTYIRENYGDNSYPLQVESSNPFTKSMLVSYCLTIPTNPYSKSKIKMVAQKHTTVAQNIDDVIVPTGGDPVVGSFDTLSHSVHDLDFVTSVNLTPSILFVFTIPKNDQLISLKHFHLYDENGEDISQYSLLIYDGHKYLYDEDLDNWLQPI